jgi:serine protease AprX
MTIEIPRLFIEHVLLGSPNARRQLQDSPILGDVWIKFGDEPAKRQQLLITSHKSTTARAAATAIYRRMKPMKTATVADIGFLQGVVAASLTFEEVLRDIVPLTSWWNDENTQKEIKAYLRPGSAAKIDRVVETVLRDADADLASLPQSGAGERLSALDRYAVLAGLMLWAADERSAIDLPSNEDKKVKAFAAAVLSAQPPIGRILRKILDEIHKAGSADTMLFQVSLNRQATAAIYRSVPAVKGDAARSLFSVNCSDIAWAIIDSGIDGTHPALRDKEGNSRVVRSYDFTNFRRIVSLSNEDAEFRKENLKELRKNRTTPLPKNADKLLLELAKNAHATDEARGINWDHVEKLVKLGEKDVPTTDHGTHVAGILGARKDDDDADAMNGMCPDIMLYDFRVLGPTLKDTEFAIIGALQYIRHLNARHSFVTIHGANLSLSIPHDVRNYACGRTPICMECEQLVDAGVVVVAAAGNLGYQRFETRDGLYEGYAAFSVTDPGNADGVITVGATHRFSPHTYGVSFFSSRGPTGDGRSKPDLVAPGERIRATIPGKQWGDLDGTSMAAPHVSGAAAMLMARYTELIGQPRRIKRILCDTATDLGRERSFQGRGMLDVLRAFQSI